MKLEPIDRALLAGEHGAAAARAMALLVRYGTACGAERFIAIESAHIDGCLYHGPSSIDFAQRFVDLGGKVRVPTTLNVAAVDVTHPGWHCGPPEVIAQQETLTRLHEQLGCLPTLTCAPYQRMARPRRGEHVAWAESNAIVFINSVLGARTDRYGDFTDLCAALTGRVPLAGLHCDEARWPAVVFDLPSIDVAGLPRDLYFAAVGYVVGRRAPGIVPYLRGLPLDANEDELKALGATGASSGALALFHAEGVTPEAADMPTGGVKAEAISPAETAAAIASLCRAAKGERVAAVCLGTPHYSIDEFAKLARTVEARHRSPETEVYVSTSREIAAAVAEDAAFDALRAFGVHIVVDTCTYLAPVVRQTSGLILTTSGKYAHYGPGNLGRRVALMTLERCIRSAETGVVAAPC
ncbi:MAG TPA: aconitase X catalytic domain-containing protein [Sphingopyxis sp.]|uniref:aconitase X catalytic domain-containing protein n=1 Tax=Sphingopyxis sp. TaxID=1908224 RepID=UPI002D05D713|nr:aconitase X catalytic domain-containing protein [Sphingopyxis sp.]HWW57791.1 aconitase X catalytic domain-containing protein [Sphingopyxis sp.]